MVCRLTLLLVTFAYPVLVLEFGANLIEELIEARRILRYAAMAGVHRHG
jgi:hypothetical protein